MDDTAFMAIAAASSAAILQALKDNMNLAPASLRWVAAIIGALAGGGAGFTQGGDTAPALATNAGLGAVVVTGIHSLLLQNSVLGRVLKAIGTALFQKPPSPPGA